ncbi:hypothetical protein [Deinococcus pimensis]|uniref:hypothetical protein n=1 Tax=Deinococcus pimensis TaxID=309888 RepID=UPI0004BA3B70|nr:hypothetical protein [Deinococcus pimensis]
MNIDARWRTVLIALLLMTSLASIFATQKFRNVFFVVMLLIVVLVAALKKRGE